MRLNDTRGFSILSAITALAVLCLVGTAVLHGTAFYRMQSLSYQRKLVADTFASEGLEFFAAFDSRQLNTFLSAGGLYRYPLCAQVNVLDRIHTNANTTVILNRDNTMDLPHSLLDRAEPQNAPNRYYQVQVVTFTGGSNPSITVNPARCQTIGSRNIYTPAADERFLVTVGVTWVPPEGTANMPQRVVLSTLLVPQRYVTSSAPVIPVAVLPPALLAPPPAPPVLTSEP
jgi:hypothetical protein